MATSNLGWFNNFRSLFYMIKSPCLNEQNLPLFDGYDHGTALIFWWRSQIFTAPPLLHLHYLQRPPLCNLRKLEAEPQAGRFNHQKLVFFSNTLDLDKQSKNEVVWIKQSICNTLALSNQEFVVRFFKHRRWAINNCDFIHWNNGGRQWKPWVLTIKYCLFQEFATIEFEASKVWVLTATNMFRPSNTMFFLIKMMNPTRMEKKRVHCLGYYSTRSMKQVRILRPHQKRGLQLSLEEKHKKRRFNPKELGHIYELWSFHQVFYLFFNNKMRRLKRNQNRGLQLEFIQPKNCMISDDLSQEKWRWL